MTIAEDALRVYCGMSAVGILLCRREGKGEVRDMVIRPSSNKRPVSQNIGYFVTAIR
jgi:hypothetical protein